MPIPKEYVYVTFNGGLWRLTRAAYQKFMRRAAKGEEWNLDDHGTQLSMDLKIVSDLPEVTRGENMHGRGEYSPVED